MGPRNVFFSAWGEWGDASINYWILYFASSKKPVTKIPLGFFFVDNSETLSILPTLDARKKVRKMMIFESIRETCISNELPPSFPHHHGQRFYDRHHWVFPDERFVQVHQQLKDYILAEVTWRFEVQVILSRSEECRGNDAHASYKLSSSQLPTAFHSSSRALLFSKMLGELLSTLLTFYCSHKLQI